jgi:hypothetical protein
VEKVDVMEKHLAEKDNLRKQLIKKVEWVEERQENLVEKVRLVEENQTNLDITEVSEHIIEVHVKSLQCEFCDFVGKTEGGLKTHIRKMHTTAKAKQFKCWTCDFICERNADLTTPNDKYWYSHRMCLNQKHKKYILEECKQLKDDGTLKIVTDWKI